MQKKNVAVIFGGCSVEHEVSIVTGIHMIANINKDKYDVTPIYISGSGEWYTGEELMDSKVYKNFDEKSKSFKKVLIPPIPSIKAIMNYPDKIGLFAKGIFKNIDVVIPAMHGMNGEDGTIQGLLELANIPYAGSGVLGSAVGMDKILMKIAFKGADLPIVKYTYFLRDEWNDDKISVVDRIEKEFKYPIFVKPSNLGSSIGISRAKDRESLINAIEIAINYDRRIIIEEGVQNPLEINCSILGFANKLRASLCEEPINWEEFLTFDDKYLRGTKGYSKSEGVKEEDRRIPAQISAELTEQIEKLALQAFTTLDCRGVARIDFIIDRETMKPYVNEINTIPGLFSSFIWEPTGLKYPDLIDELIDIAFKVHEEKKKNTYSYSSKILQNGGTGVKIHGDGSNVSN